MGQIFTNPNTLSHGFVPDKLPTREDIRKKILEESKRFFEISTSNYRGIHIYGDVGTGKTVLSRRIGIDLVNIFGHNIILCYVNCRFSRRIYRVLAQIAGQISDTLPQRGLSKDEFIELIFTVASEKTGKMLLILDELDSLFWGDEATKTADTLYAISRFSEKKGNLYDLNLLVISISREQTFLYKWLDQSTRASFVQTSKYLTPYSTEDLFRILKYRATLAFRHGAFDDDLIHSIASFVCRHGRGNARMAIDLLKLSGEIAEAELADMVKPEHFRAAIKEYAIIPQLDDEVLLAMDKQKLILLMSIIEALERTDKSYVTRHEVYQFYQELCGEYGETPRKSTQMWRYLKELQIDLKGILEVFVSGKNQKGRSTRIMVNVPLRDLKLAVIKIMHEYKKTSKSSLLHNF